MGMVGMVEEKGWNWSEPIRSDQGSGSSSFQNLPGSMLVAVFMF